MRIAIDGYNLALPRGTGVASYAVELARAIEGMGWQVEGVFGRPVPAAPELREAVFLDTFRDPAPQRRSNRYQRAWRFVRAFRPPRAMAIPMSGQAETRGLADQLPAFSRLVTAPRLFEDAMTVFKATGRFTRLRLPDPPDVMHWTYPVPVAVPGVPNIYTLHDLVPLRLPYTTLDDKALYGRLVARCLAGAAQVCTVSETSRRDIIARFNLDPARVTNTYQTARLADAALAADPADDAAAVHGVFGLPHRGYFIYYGAIEPKKNVGRLIEAYLSLRSATPLVIVGAPAWQSEQELRLLPGDGAGGAPGTFSGHGGQTVLRLDYLPRELLAKLVRGARALVFPSLYEGFGLPVLEAMCLGTPVITSTAGSMPEIAGAAALLVDPYDVAALRDAMRRLDDDDGLRERLSMAGRDRAERFARPRYQERLAALYDQALVRR